MKFPATIRFLLPLALGTLVAATAWCAAASPAAPARATTTTTRKAARTAHRHARPAAAVAKTAPGTAGLKIYLDPETGRLGAPPAGAQALAQDIDPLNESDAGLVQVRMPDGHYMMDLKGRFAENVVVQIDPSGRRVMRCVRSRAELLQSPVAPTPKQEEK